MLLCVHIQLNFYKTPFSAEFDCIVCKSSSFSIFAALTFCVEFFLFAQYLQEIIHIKTSELYFKLKQSTVMFCNFQPILRIDFLKWKRNRLTFLQVLRKFIF